jgi:hypothetical protein
MRNQRRHIQEKEQEAHSPEYFGPTIDIAALQAQPEACHAKAVVRGASPGAATPGVRAHPFYRLLGPPSSSGAINALGGRFGKIP